MSQVQILSARPEALETLCFQGFIFLGRRLSTRFDTMTAQPPRLDGLQLFSAQLANRVRHIVQSFRPESRVCVQRDAG